MTKLQSILFDELISLKKHVNRMLGMGILFIIMAHFFIVQPYFQYQKEQEKLLIKWNKNKQQLENAQRELKNLNKIDKQIKSVSKKVKQNIQNFPRELRRTLPKIKKELSPAVNSENRNFSRMSQQRQQALPIRILPPNIRTFEEGVNWYTKDRLNAITKQLQKSIITPLNRLKMLSENEKTESLFQKSEEEISDYIRKIEPNFWHTFSGKGRMAEGVNNVIKNSFEPIFTKIDKAKEQLNLRQRSKQNEYTLLKEKMQKLKKLKNNLESRLKNLDSPIGKLPVGLIDFIKLFPIIVVIFMVMLTLKISRSSYLHSMLNKDIELEDKAVDKSIFNNLINCWYLPPYQSKLEFLLLWGIFLLISLIYLQVCYLIMESQGLFTSLILQEESLQRSFYMGFYLLGGVIILACLAHIKKIH